MVNQPIVEVSNGVETKTVEDVINVSKEDGTLCLETTEGTNRFGEEWSIESMNIQVVDIMEGDWVQYVMNSEIREGEVINVSDTVVTVKQAPNGWLEKIPVADVVSKS